MSNYPPAAQYPAANGSSAPRLQNRHSGDFRKQAANGTLPGATNSNGPMPVPTTSAPTRGGNGNAAAPNSRAMMPGPPGFDGPRSPPSNKNTSHVPCKFFRQGACQAGKACPFLHSTEPTTETAPCKYFQKGNCKFGQKCALAHILPDGRRVNRPMGLNGGGGAINIGGRVPLITSADAAPGSSLLSMQAHMQAPTPTSAYPYPIPDEFQSTQRPSPYDTIPTIDTTFTSHPGSNFGSPPNEGRMIGSPVQKGLSVLDVPLPASFDSQGVSHMARYGPIAASVPSRFGLGSSPPSSFQDKTPIDSPALRNLHNSAFGDDHLRTSRNGLLGSSPPAGMGDDYLTTRRIMHSERFARSKMLSSSLGARAPLSAGATDDWDDPTFTFEEDLVPTSLHELLTPQEKMRRFSRSAVDEEREKERDSFMFSTSHRACLSGLGTPADNHSSSKVGSPLASSPSRFGPLFTRTHGKPSGDTNDTSAFGHVGSPLRSSLHPSASPSMRPQRPLSGDLSSLSPYLASPTRPTSMSMISQQLQRTKLSNRTPSGSSASGLDSPAGERELGTGNSLAVGTSRSTSGTLTPVEGRNKEVSSNARHQAERAVSSGSVTRAERIEEEQGVFNMEEDDTDSGSGQKDTKPTLGGKEKRYSGGLGGSSSAWGGWGLGAKRGGVGSGNSSASGLGGAANTATGN